MMHISCNLLLFQIKEVQSISIDKPFVNWVNFLSMLTTHLISHQEYLHPILDSANTISVWFAFPLVEKVHQNQEDHKLNSKLTVPLFLSMASLSD